MTTTLLDLPAEIILQIISYLLRDDARNLRLVSKSLERIYFDDFARQHFRKRGFMITSDSLNVLSQIAQHESIREYVQHLWFNPDCFTFARCPCISDDDPATDIRLLSAAHGRLPVCAIYAACQADHWSLLHGSTLTKLLAVAFRALPSLKTVGMRRGEDHNPYGWKSIAKQTGQDPRLLGDMLPRFTSAPFETTYLFTAILSAIHNSKVHLHRLYTDAVQIEHPAIDFPADDQIASALSSIRYLEINAIGVPVSEDEVTSTVKSDGHGRLETVLRSMSGLYEIGLTIFKDHKQRHMVAPTPALPASWRESYPFNAFKRISETTRFYDLRRVKLEKITTTAGTLMRFLQYCSPVLMSLKLRHIQLLSDEEAEKGTAWSMFFGFLAEQCRSLEYLLLYSLVCDGLSIRFTSHIEEVSSDNFRNAEAPLLVRDHIGTFTNYETISLEVIGRATINERLSVIRDQHWSGRKLFSYAMDDTIWFTDTSDEEW